MDVTQRIENTLENHPLDDSFARGFKGNCEKNKRYKKREWRMLDKLIETKGRQKALEKEIGNFLFFNEYRIFY